MRSGYGRCSASAFQSYCTAAANGACYSAAAAITDVAPGTNDWAPRPWYPSGPAIPVVVSPGSIIGGGAGSATIYAELCQPLDAQPMRNSQIRPPGDSPYPAWKARRTA